MDGIRDWFSRLRKGLTYLLRGRKRKPDRTRTNTAEESDGPSGSLPRPELRGTGGGHDEGSGTSTGGRQVRSRDQFPQLESMPAGGSDDNRRGREADIDGSETSHKHSHPDPDVGIAVASGSSRETEQVYPPPSTPSIPHSGKPDSM